MNLSWIADDFPRDYVAEIRAETPPGQPPVEGIYVTVTNHSGSCWTLPFFSAMPGYPLVTGLVSVPARNALLVICGGTASYVLVENPAQNQFIRQCMPTRQAVSSFEDQCVLLADYTSITCIGSLGVNWTSDRLVLDDLSLLGVENGEISFQGLDPSDPRKVVNGRIDVKTGAPLRHGRH
jgi:hypothetical protein